LILEQRNRDLEAEIRERQQAESVSRATGGTVFIQGKGTVKSAEKRAHRNGKSDYPADFRRRKVHSCRGHNQANETRDHNVSGASRFFSTQAACHPQHPNQQRKNLLNGK